MIRHQKTYLFGKFKDWEKEGKNAKLFNENIPRSWPWKESPMHTRLHTN